MHPSMGSHGQELQLVPSCKPLLQFANNLISPPDTFPNPDHLHQIYLGTGSGSGDAFRLGHSLDSKQTRYLALPPTAPIDSSRAADSGFLVIGNSQQELIDSSKVTAQEMLDATELAASRNHSEAERCRQECINSHLSSLCSLLPSSTKTDKASLLAEVIDHLIELKQHAADVGDGASMPMDVNELQINMDPLYGEGWHVLRVTFGCNDRADLFQDLIRIFINQLDFRLLKAEIATLSGHIKCIIHVAARSSSNNKQVMTAATEETDRSSSITALKEALCSFMEEKQVSAAGMSP